MQLNLANFISGNALFAVQLKKDFFHDQCNGSAGGIKKLLGGKEPLLYSPKIFASLYYEEISKLAR